jgi:lipopolysaccharide export system permease protein
MTLARYLSAVLGLRILAAAALLLALGVSLDLIRTGDALIRTGGSAALLSYAALRAPALAATILPLAVLVGAMTGFLALGRRGELTAMRAAGQSAFALLRRLLPLALALGAAHHLLVAEATAWSERAVAARFGAAAEAPVPEPGERIAGRIGEVVVVSRLARADGSALASLTVYLLDPEGRIEGRVEAARARHKDGRWALADARRIGAAPAEADGWATALAPSDVRALATRQRAAGAGEAAAALSGAAVATRSRAYYETRLAQSRAALAVPAVMLACAAFAGFLAPRGPGGLGMAALGALVGLAFVTVEGILVSLGQVGLVPAGAAAWGPVASFAILAAWLLLMREE